MKANEIQPCAVCGQGVMHAGVPLFWEITLKRHGVDRQAVNQVAGLEMMLGSVALARVMGPDPDISAPVAPARTILVCELCASKPVSVYELGLTEEDCCVMTA